MIGCCESNFHTNETHCNEFYHIGYNFHSKLSLSGQVNVHMWEHSQNRDSELR